MMNKEEFEKGKKILLAIPDEKVKNPGMPMMVVHQEADDLEHWCSTDRDLLFANGLNEELFNTLSYRINLCREAQSRWNKESLTKADAQKLWQAKAEEYYTLRNDMLRSFGYAYRKHEELKAVTEKIAEGNSNADMVQDLIDLGILGKEHPNPLKAINFDMSKLEKAHKGAEEIGDVLAAANGERISDKEAKIIRDRAYTYLMEAVNEIRECGRYIFWDNPDRLEGYQSRYSKKMQASYRSRRKEKEMEA